MVKKPFPNSCLLASRLCLRLINLPILMVRREKNQLTGNAYGMFIRLEENGI